MTFPTIHLNGTARETLTEDYQAASLAIAAACRVLEAASPNGRDYYTQGADALSAAETEHRSRLQRLIDVRTEIETIINHVNA